MTIPQVKIHKYLGMIIEYSLLEKLKWSTVDYIGNTPNEILEDTREESATPATHHIFDMMKGTTILSQTNADSFYFFLARFCICQSKHTQT